MSVGGSTPKEDMMKETQENDRISLLTLSYIYVLSFQTPDLRVLLRSSLACLPNSNPRKLITRRAMIRVSQR